MIETLTSSPDHPLNHNFNGVIDGLIGKVAEGELNHEAAFRHGWRAAFVKEVTGEERTAGLTKLFDSFPETIRYELSRPLSEDLRRRSALAIIAAQEQDKAEREGRAPRSKRIYQRRETASMRSELEL